MLRILLMNEHMNAIDDQENLVGFSTSDDCCAHGGWFISDEKITDSEKFFDMKEEKKLDYHFDTDYVSTEHNSEDGGVVIFKLVPDWGSEETKPLYLHLYNCHNGYYGKGFSHNFKGQRIEGCI